ncbi:hypothetical protein BD410DRAFT_847052 [Rickenella mellea]|uniref:BAH domain-containing protein n=1 Tax=Rickenella mellea TaxID=50990 RepID=A0A4Y7PE71_9AGAM|nr:hypothetical protein BD410DRAFT_847052 [Rickenella mellea]
MPRASRNTKRTHATRSRPVKPARNANVNARKNPLKAKFDAGSPVDEYERCHNGHSSVITPGAFVLIQPAGLQVAPEGEPHPHHIMWKAVVQEIHVDEKDDVAILLIHWFYSRDDMIELAARENLQLRSGSWEESFSKMEIILTDDEEYIEADTVEDVVNIFHWNEDKIKDVEPDDIYYRYTYNVLTQRLNGFKSTCSQCRKIYIGKKEDEQRFCDQCDRWIHTKCLQNAKVRRGSAEHACKIFLKGKQDSGDYNMDGVDRDGLYATLMTPIVRPKTCRIQGNATSVLAVRRTVERRERMTKAMRTWVKDMAPKLERRRDETFYVCPIDGCRSPM